MRAARRDGDRPAAPRWALRRVRRRTYAAARADLVQRSRNPRQNSSRHPGGLALQGGQVNRVAEPRIEFTDETLHVVLRDIGAEVISHVAEKALNFGSADRLYALQRRIVEQRPGVARDNKLKPAKTRVHGRFRQLLCQLD